MSRIKILPEILSNKIAAGEVVERPASVVKELVENAIDAQSSKISIEIEKGGRSLIQVSDNGQGMSHDDALLAIERYATSKIFTDSDLYAISTLGFRGEALPSIAAVSKFTLVTKDQDSLAGTQVYVEGGKILKVTETGAPTGTMISAGQLFFNTPARRKFLKSVNTEMGHIADNVACAAIAWPQIQFKLIHNQKVVKNWPAVENPFDRVVEVLGHDLKTSLYPINGNAEDILLSGWTSDPFVTRSTSQKIFIFVNGRYVRDRGIAYALFEGYKGRIMKGQFPVAVLFLTLPAEEVDVNVHPTKHEVRFARQQQVYELVRSSAEQLFRTQKPVSWAKMPEPAPRIQEELPPYRIQKPYAKPSSDQFLFSTEQIKKRFSDTSKTAYVPDAQAMTETPSPEPPSQEFAKSANKKSISDCSIIGQFQNTYILCEQDHDLMIVDQHAAHERIVYERLKREQSQQEKRQIQSLMIPETIELSYKEAAVIEQMLPDLNKLGLEIEHFGGNTFVVKSVPTQLADRRIKPLIDEIAETMDAIGYSKGFSDVLDECLILMACHGAIRAHQPLSAKEIRELLVQLDQCENPYSCPHGRPTVVRWPLNQFEKSFKRTG